MPAIVRTRAELARAIGKGSGQGRDPVVSGLVAEALDRANAEAFDRMYGGVVEKLDSIIERIGAVGQSGESALAAVLQQIKETTENGDDEAERRAMQDALDKLARELQREPKYVDKLRKAIVSSLDERMADLVEALTALRAEMTARAKGERSPEKWRMEVQRDQSGRIVDATFTSI